MVRYCLILLVATRIAIAAGADSLRVQAIHAGLSTAFAMETGETLYLVDAGSPGQERAMLRQLRAFSQKPLRLIIITHAHFDHYGSAKRLRDLTGARIVIGADDFDDMRRGLTPIRYAHGWGMAGTAVLPVVERVMRPAPTQADLTVRDGDSLTAFGLPARVVATPGHTRGAITIMIGERAFVSDLIVSHPRVKSQCYYAWDWDLIAASLRRIQAMRPTLIYSGHATKPLDGEGFAKLTPVVGTTTHRRDDRSPE